MAWTAPRTWVVGELVTAAFMNTHVRDNLKYLKGQAGQVDVEDILTVPLTSGTNGKGLRFGATSYANMQGLDLGGNSYVFFCTNRQYDGTGWQQLNTRAAGLLQITQDEFQWQTFPASSSVPTRRMTLDNTGNLGIGLISPTGKLHTYDTISGMVKWEYDGVDGTARTVIPNAAGDVLYRLSGLSIVRASDGTVQGYSDFAAIGTPTPGGNFDIYSAGAGANKVTVTINANGAVTVARSAGALTYKVSLLLMWL